LIAVSAIDLRIVLLLPRPLHSRSRPIRGDRGREGPVLAVVVGGLWTRGVGPGVDDVAGIDPEGENHAITDLDELQIESVRLTVRMQFFADDR
jgi:hypothetical protein